MFKRFLPLIIIFSILSLFLGLKIQEKVFIEANLKFELSKDQIKDKADIIAAIVDIPKDFRKDIIISEDKDINDYSSYALEGVTTVNKLIKEKIYFPINWIIKYSKNLKEFKIFLNSLGEFIGFQEKLIDTELLKDIGEVDSLKKAKENLKSLGLSLEKFDLKDKSMSIASSGRKDYMFSFERKTDFLKEATINLDLVVSGGKVISFTKYSKVPQSFKKSYSKIVEKNLLISKISTIFALCYVTFILYMFLVGKLKNSLNIQKSMIISLFLVALVFINDFTNLSTFNYKLSSDFLLCHLQRIINNLNNLIIPFILFTLLLSAVEYIDRKAFPEHLNFLSIFNVRFLASNQFLKLLSIGYISVGFDMLFEASFYLIVTKYLGWKVFDSGLVSISLFSKNLAFISTFKDSFFAGLIEEAIFRVVPIALINLYFKNFNKKYRIGFFFIVQVLIFGACHANYPNSPSYFRIVELIIPSIWLGSLYMNYGLIPAVISHYFYDFILMSLPIFKNVSFFGIYQIILIIVLMFLPLIAHFALRFFKIDEPIDLKNKNISNHKIKDIELVEEHKQIKISKNFILILIIIGSIINKKIKVKTNF